MPLPAMLSVVCILCAVGVICLTESVLRILLREKTNPHTVIIYMSAQTDDIEYRLRRIVKKYPASRIVISCDGFEKKAEALFTVLKKKYPLISIVKTDDILPQ